MPAVATTRRMAVARSDMTPVGISRKLRDRSLDVWLRDAIGEPVGALPCWSALLAAILGAVMSTLSCQLLVCSSALTEDIYRTFLRKNASQTELVWVGRAMVMAIALVAILIARNPEAKVLGMVSYAWAGFGAAFGPVLILSLFWSRMTRNGALAGMLVGAVTVVLWKQVGWFGLYEIIPGFILAWLATVVVSHLSQPSASMLKNHQAVETELRTIQA